MAESVTIAGEEYLRRRPIVVLLLTIVTVLVYWVVWYYKINDEARHFLRDDRVVPWLCVLAIFPGVLLIVPPFVSIYRTGMRIRRMELSVGAAKPVQPAMGVVCAFLTTVTLIFAGGTGYYYQTHLNQAYAASLGNPAVTS